MKWTREIIREELLKIQASAPKLLQKKVVINTPITPTIKMVMEEGLKDPNISQEKKDEIKTLLDAGYFSQEKYQEDPKVAKKLDNYMQRQINKAVKEGRLPNKKLLTQLEKEWQKQERNTCVS